MAGRDRMAGVSGVTLLFGLLALPALLFWLVFGHTLPVLRNHLHIPAGDVVQLLVILVIVGAVLVLFFGWLTDHIGRERLLLSGALLALAASASIAWTQKQALYPVLLQAPDPVAVVVVADPATCSPVLEPTGLLPRTSGCDVARGILVEAGAGFTLEPGRPGDQAIVQIGASALLSSVSLEGLENTGRQQVLDEFTSAMQAALVRAGYLPGGEDEAPGILLAGVVVYAMVVVPATLMALESLPTRQRCRGFAVSQALAQGLFGALLPLAGYLLVSSTGRLYALAWAGAVVAGLAVLILVFSLEETRWWSLDEVD